MNLSHEALEQFYPGASRIEWTCTFEKDIGGAIFRVFEHTHHPIIGIIEMDADIETEDGDRLMFVLNPEVIAQTKLRLQPN
jgi:hypothetical protein